MACYAFFDTDVLYHYPLLKDINWPCELSADTVVLIYSPIVVRQLNRHKDNTGDHRRRKKASDAIRRLEEWLDRDPPEELRPHVSLTERPFDPTINFAAIHLSRDVEDDWLLATAIEFRRELPAASTDRVVVVTGDRGLAVKARHQPEIGGHRLRDNLRQSEVEDTVDREVRELRQRIQTLEHAMPKLRLGFPGGDAHAAFTLQPPLLLDEDMLTEKLVQIRKKYPKMSPPPDDEHYRRMMGPMEMYSPEAIAKYNETLDSYYARCEEYERRANRHQNWPRLTIKLPVMLFNDGSAVAENVKVFLLFPEGCLIQDDDDVPPKPTPPDPPPKPTSIIDALSPHHRLYNMPQFVPAIRPIPRTHAARGNVLGPDITHGSGDRIRFDIEQAMHHVPETLPALYLTFASYDAAGPFEIDCQIHATKLPHSESQKLHVVIKKMEGASKGNALQAI